MLIYALSYRNPYDEAKPLVLFVAAERLLSETDVLTAGVTAVRADALGNEWVEAVAGGSVCGPLEIDGTLGQPTIAIVVE